MTTRDDLPADAVPPTTDGPARARQMLRERADIRLRLMGDTVVARTDIEQLVHDLHVHQIELEMQNEELRRSEVALTAARDRYVDLYDRAPTGYLTLDPDGKIREANLPACQLFGINRTGLLGQPVLRLVAAKDQPIWIRYLRELVTTGAPQVCELELAHKAPDRTSIHVASVVMQGADGSPRLYTTLLNITARVRADEQQQHTLALLTNVLNATPDLIFLKDLNLRTILCNDAFAQACGKPPADLLGHTDIENGWDPELVRGNPDKGIRGYEQDDREALRGTVLRIPSEPVRVGADIRLFDTHKLPLRSATGHIIGVLGIARDITEQRRIETTLRERSAALAQFKTTLDQTHDCVFIFAPDTLHFIYCNQGAVMQVGYSEAELFTMTPIDIKPEFSVESFLTMVRPLVDGRQLSLTFETLHRHKDGHDIPVEVALQLVRQAGEAPRYVAIVRDISERKQADAVSAAQIKALAEFKAALDAHAIVAITDETGRISYVNDKFCQISGYTREELQGQDHRLLNSGYHPKAFIKEMWHTIANGKVWSGEIQNRAKDGSHYWVATTIVPFFGADTKPIQYIAIRRDISARKQTEMALYQRGRDLHSAIEERERISHDLHDGILQSLFAVGLTLESAKLTMPPSNLKESSASLNQAIGQLNDVMREIRNFIAGLDSGLLRGKDFQAVLKQMLASLTEHQATRVHLAVEGRAAKALSTEQSLHLIRVIQEAVSNCIKHGHAREARVSLKMLKRGVRLSVRDNGCGFNQDDVKGIGHGLGNMAARARKIGGQFTLLSKVNEGTSIVLDFPKEAADVSR
ncbi:MAG: Sensor histidine kinase LiaS [Nitrospira sp.]|nr:Sensor histidine kinase LiaS [Nitrospira sp.]